MQPLVLAVDQGTTNTKAVLVNPAGDITFTASTPLTLSTPQPGFVEQDANALWQSVTSVIARAVQHAAASGSTIQGLALSNQRETAVAWHRGTLQPLAPAVTWQCRRSAQLTHALAPHADRIRHVTGLPLDPVLSATKFAWLLRCNDAVQQAATSGDLCFGTVDSWLIAKLTAGQHITDITNASRTGLLDLASCQWSSEMLTTFGIPANTVPALVDSAAHLGQCTGVPGLEGVPIVAALGDSHAALAGNGAFTAGSIKATYGTGSSLMTLTASPPSDTRQLARTVAWSIAGQPQFALEGNIFMTGSAISWLGSFLGLDDPASTVAELADTVADAAGLVFVPAMVGLGAPHWRPDTRAAFLGLDRTHTGAHLARAAVESIAFQIADVFFAMRDAAHAELPLLRADGGASRNNSLMQFQADLLGVPVHRSHTAELSALGAALLGGLTLGWWPSLQHLADLPHPVDVFTPRPIDPRHYAGWQRAVAAAIAQEVHA